MSLSYIETEHKEGVLVIHLNRPDVLNSFHQPMAFELQSVLDQAKENDSVRAILLTGKGRAFCAGQDLAEAMNPNGPDIKTIVETTYNPIVLKIRQMPKPVVCAVNGVAAGAGANIAFACDITLASEQAKFIQSFSNIGLIPDSGGTWLLPRLIGMQRASALAMLAEKLSADEAMQMGLIWKVLPLDALFNEALNLAKQLARMPTRGLALTKMAFNQGQTQTLEAHLASEAIWQAEAANSQDHKEGVEAFLEKRNPKFIGK